MTYHPRCIPSMDVNDDVQSQSKRCQQHSASSTSSFKVFSHLSLSRNVMATTFLVFFLGTTLVPNAEGLSPSSRYPSSSVRMSVVDVEARTLMTGVLKSTLNDDGDFCIEGINDDKSNTNQNDDDGEQFTSLLDMEYNQVKNSKLSDLLTPSTSTLSENDDDVRFETIQLDGEDDSNWSSNDPSALDPFPFLQSATQAVAPIVDTTNQNKNVQGTATTSSPITPSTVPPQPVASTTPAMDVEDQAAAEALEGFLDSIFDGQVAANDIGRYAVELVAIGFDPDCEWSKELELNDLNFMKQLHQRFFWKEWEKLL